MTIKQLKQFIENLPDSMGIEIQIGDYNKPGVVTKTSVGHLATKKGECMYWSPSEKDYTINDNGEQLILYGETR